MSVPGQLDIGDKFRFAVTCRNLDALDALADDGKIFLLLPWIILLPC